MIKRFLSLEWKAFFRSASLGKNLGIKIVMGFLSLYFITMFLIMGLALYPALKDFFPEKDPLLIVNTFLFYWVIGDLVFRFFFQKLPVMSVKPLLTLPIKRSKVIHYVLGKSAFSFFNLLPLFAIIPFGITLLFQDYPVTNVTAWMLALILVVFIINFMNFIVESFSAEKELSVLPLIILVGGLYAVNYFNIISFSNIVGYGFNAIYKNPLLVIVPLLMLAVCYIINYNLLKQKLFLDSGLKTKIEQVNTSNLEWTKSFGDIAPFLQLDLKLIWRNKRTKSSVWMIAFGLLYGLVFYTNPQFMEITPSYIFVGIFSTGIFLMNFGQFIPAWDSSYYKLLMSQNIKYQHYLKSKFTLMVISVLILFILGIPYVFFGWKILLAHFAAAIYNMGINTHVILLGGSFNRKKIDLSQKAVFNYQGTGAVQWLIGIPLLLLPMGIFAAFYFLVNFEMACLVLIILGLIGIAFHQKFMKIITQKYLDSKYKMINAFNQNN